VTGTERTSETDTWSFLHVNDHHLGTPQSYRFRPAINQRWSAIKSQMTEIDADFLLVGGDLTRDGETHEFELEQARDDLSTLPFPSFVIPGNMDVGNKHTKVNGSKIWDKKGLGWNDVDLNVTQNRIDVFSSYFGAPNWTFLHKDVRFTGFYTGVAGSGLPQEERFWRMLEVLPSLPPARHHIAVMHYWPFMEHLDEPAWDLTNIDEYDNWYFSMSPPHRQRLWQLLKDANVEILMCGHVHTGRPVQIVDGIRIYRTSAGGNTAQLADRWPDAETRFGFHRGTVTDSGIDVEFVPGADQCDEFGTFGPWGHPPVDERDYSAAQKSPALFPDH
jgi:predicted MPP superfamily phosphohydrolase